MEDGADAVVRGGSHGKGWAVTRLVNGVFQGGGAKGVAYAGALQAARDRDLWFGSVAGASVGAVTASMIAAGYTPDELEVAIPAGLGAARAPIGQRLGLAVLGRATSVLEGDRLRRWLDDRYAAKIGGERPVTFEQMYRATGVELYVLALDLADGMPVVFSRRTTPTVEVAGAVAASSAIPAMFPAGRAVFDVGGGRTRVHQFVDGATWANYPAFIFSDDFRCFLRGEAQLERSWDGAERAAWEAEERRPVVGFVLGEPEPIEHRNAVGFVPLDGPPIDRRFDLGPTYTSNKRVSYLIGTLLSSDWARLVIGVSLVVWVAFAIATLPVAFRRFSTWLAAWLPDPAYPIALVGLLTAVVLALTVMVLLVGFVMTISRLLADTALPTIDSMLGISTEVPPWVGAGAGSVVIRVPREGLTLMGFDVDEAVRTRAVAAARAGVGEQLDGEAGARLEALFEAREPELPTYRRGDRPLPVDDPVTTSPWFVLAATIVATAVVGGSTWWATNSAATEGIGVIMLAIVVAIVAALAAFVFLGDQTRRRASRRATLGVDPGATRMSPTVVTAIGAALVAAGLGISIVAMAERDDTTVRAEVIQASEVDAGNRYLVRTVDDAARRSEVVSDRHLRLGESVFVEFGPDGSADLVGALDDVRFAVAVVVLALGVGAVTSAERRRRWLARCRRVDEVTAAWSRREGAT